MIFNPDDFGITTADLSTSEMYRVDFTVRGKAAEYFSYRYGVSLNQTLAVYICDGPQRMLLQDRDNYIKHELTPRDMRDVYSSVFLHEVPTKIRRFLENDLSKRGLELTDRTVRYGYEDLLYLYPNNYLRTHGLPPLRGERNRLFRRDFETFALNAGLITKKKPLNQPEPARREYEFFYF